MKSYNFFHVLHNISSNTLPLGCFSGKWLISTSNWFDPQFSTKLLNTALFKELSRFLIFSFSVIIILKASIGFKCSFLPGKSQQNQVRKYWLEDEEAKFIFLKFNIAQSALEIFPLSYAQFNDRNPIFSSFTITSFITILVHKRILITDSYSKSRNERGP